MRAMQECGHKKTAKDVGGGIRHAFVAFVEVFKLRDRSCDMLASGVKRKFFCRVVLVLW
jgi:hypothetical protein